MFRSYGSINSKRTCQDVLNLLRNNCRAEEMVFCKNQTFPRSGQEQIELASFSEYPLSENDRIRQMPAAIPRKPGCRLGLKRVITKTFEDEPPMKKERELNKCPQLPGMRCFRVLYAKPQTKKHKTWEDDGYLYFGKGSLSLRSLEDETVAKTPFLGQRLAPGDQFTMGDRVVQIQEELIEPNS